MHILNASVSGSTRVLVGAVYTDAEVIAVALFTKLNFTELWLWFDARNNQRYIPIHPIAVNLGSTTSSSLPLFHALTGCDEVSFFAERGKKRTWNTWKQYDKLTDVLDHISVCPSQEHVNTALRTLEKFVVLFHDQASTCTSINEGKIDLFCRNVDY